MRIHFPRNLWHVMGGLAMLARQLGHEMARVRTPMCIRR